MALVTKHALIELLSASKQVQIVTLSVEQCGIVATYMDVDAYSPLVVPDVTARGDGYTMYGVRAEDLPLVLDNARFEGVSCKEEARLTRVALAELLTPGTLVLRASATQPGRLALSYRDSASVCVICCSTRV
jgi:hypothetical protein